MGRGKKGKWIVGRREMEVKGTHYFSSFPLGQKLGGIWGIEVPTQCKVTRILIHCWGEHVMTSTLWQMSGTVLLYFIFVCLNETKIWISYDPELSILGKSIQGKPMFTKIFTQEYSAFFTIGLNLEIAQVPLNRKIDKMWYIHLVKYDRVIKKRWLLIQIATWTNLPNIH